MARLPGPDDDQRGSPLRARVNRAAKAYAVGKALLYDFHNSRNGRCFPRIRQSRRLRVAEYIAALEDAGILTWDQRICIALKLHANFVHKTCSKVID